MIAKIKIQQDLVEIASASKELAQLQVKAGNVNPLFFQSKLADIQQANLELEQTKMEMISIRKKLGVLMGLSHDNWQVLPELSKLPQQEEPIEDLEMLALKERFDVAAARKELEVIASTGAQKKWWSYTNGQIGVSTEKEPEGIQETGPAFGLSIPLFNYGQADRARLLAQYRQKQASLRALEIEVKAQVRAIQEKLMRSRRIVKYYIQSVIPVRKKILSSAQEQYNIMAIGTYDLLQAKYEELQSQLHYETSLGQYWIHRSELALAVGGNLLLRKQP
jgi:outer membrane protein, heavy metal efflux system